jgi:signal transduction histidine kinase
MDVNQHLLDDPDTLAVVGRFSGRVAHEFNNLLTPLLAYPDILKSMFDPADSDGQELVGVMESAAAELARMTRQMTQLSLGDNAATPQQSFAFRDALKAAIEPMENELGDVMARLILDVPADLPKAMGRADTASHAIETVLRNALECTPGSKPVRITARLEEKQGNGLQWWCPLKTQDLAFPQRIRILFLSHLSPPKKWMENAVWAWGLPSPTV